MTVEQAENDARVMGYQDGERRAFIAGYGLASLRCSDALERLVGALLDGRIPPGQFDVHVIMLAESWRKP